MLKRVLVALALTAFAFAGAFATPLAAGETVAACPHHKCHTP